MGGRRALSSALLGSVLVIFSAWSDSGSSESSATIPAHSASALQSTTVTSRPASQPPGSPKDPPLFFTTPKRGAVVSTSGRIDYTVDGGSHWRQGNGADNAVAIDFVDSLTGGPSRRGIPGPLSLTGRCFTPPTGERLGPGSRFHRRADLSLSTSPTTSSGTDSRLLGRSCSRTTADRSGAGFGPQWRSLIYVS